MGIMDELYKETSDRLYLMNRLVGRIKGCVNAPIFNTNAQIVEQVQKIILEGEKEYQDLWDKQIADAKERHRKSGASAEKIQVDVSDQSTCCGMPIEAEKDDDGETFLVCSKCGDECGIVNPEVSND